MPLRPSGISIDFMARISSGIPSWTCWPPISMVLAASLEAVSRVSIHPNATAFTLTLNWPHSLASVFVSPTTAALPAA